MRENIIRIILLQKKIFCVEQLIGYLSSIEGCQYYTFSKRIKKDRIRNHFSEMKENLRRRMSNEKFISESSDF